MGVHPFGDAATKYRNPSKESMPRRHGRPVTAVTGAWNAVSFV